LCGIWLTAWTSRTDVGMLARRWGLLLIPEETDPPPELLIATRPETNQLGAAEPTV
jgi:membrane glycosyltransferase